MNSKDKRDLVHASIDGGVRVTLDGAPAIIAGYRNDFASVARLDGKGGRVEFAWETAWRIVTQREGRFSS